METLSSFDQNGLVAENILLLMIFFSTVCAVLAIFLVITGRRSSLKKRLDSLSVQVAQPEKKYRDLQKKVESVSPLFTPRSEDEREGTRLKLTHAGYHHQSAISYFYVIKTALMLLGLLAAVVYYLYSGTEQHVLVMSAIGAGIGMFFPNIVLEKMATNRQKRIKRGVPDALDLLIVCTEAGVGLNMALKRVSKELSVSHPELAEELEAVCIKIKSGYEMQLAFHGLVERTGVSELKGLVNMLSNAAKLGGSIAYTLRNYTEDYRDKRNQELEEIAAKIPTKMIFPMIVCIWPSFFIVVIGPALLAIFDAFASMN